MSRHAVDVSSRGWNAANSEDNCRYSMEYLSGVIKRRELQVRGLWERDGEDGSRVAEEIVSMRLSGYSGDSTQVSDWEGNKISSSSWLQQSGVKKTQTVEKDGISTKIVDTLVG